MSKEESQIISNTIFGSTLLIVILSLVGLLFPALLVTLFYPVGMDVNPLETGAWTIPFLTVNVILLGFGISYYKKILPRVFFRSINFLLGFEVSCRIAIIVIVSLLVIYIGFTFSEITLYELDQWDDFIRIEQAVREFPFNEYEGNFSIVYVKNFILWISHNILQNIKILPFIGSISLLLLTYIFTVQLTKKRFAGLIAMVIVMQSNTFLRYDTSATYANFWIVFYLLSLYFINNRSYLSHISYIFSLFAKPLTATFLPMTLFFAYNAKISNKKKKLIIIPYLIIFFLILGAALIGLKVVNIFHSFDYATFWTGFAVLSAELRYDGFFLIFLLPLVIGLFLTSRKNIKHADSILFLIMGTLLAQPLLVALTGHNILPYRYLPLIVFFAVGVGTLFSKKIIR